jgi:AraC-like DNA-binding protein/DNA-binding MarR family transcriptional regulator
MDVLADFLKTAGVTALVEPSACLVRSWLHNSSTTVNPATGFAQLRLLCVAEGEYSMFDRENRKTLTSGDVVFLLPESSYRLESWRGDSTLIVGSILFRAGAMALATLNLPEATILRGQDHSESMDLATRLAAEVQLARGGWQQVAECLATSLFITSLRTTKSRETNQGGGNGWLRALVDPEIGNALRLMHQSPEHRWTVAELADQLLISRSAFAERFKRITGRPPLEYLTWWRLQRAAARLRNGEVATMFELARNSGYQSEAAFSKAFRREFGMPPGEIRRQALTQKDTPSLLQLEIKKRNPFKLPEQEASLNLAKSFDAIRRPFDELMRSHDLTGPEYNILRILRGKDYPLTIDEILSNLLIPLTDLPEHLEKLGSKQLVNHLTGTGQWEITIQGKTVLKILDEPTLSLHRRQFANFSAGEITELNRLLVKLRVPTS